MRILANLNVVGTLDLDNVTNAAADTDKFLVQDANGVVRYRTGAEVASDIGAAVGFVSTLKHEVKLSVAVGKGKAVYISGSDGTNMLASLASNASEATSTKTLGLTESAGAQNAKVFVVSEGLLAGLDTSTATIGDPVWLGVNGELIYGLGNKPYAPAHMVFVGLVTRVNANNGEIFVKVQNGFELQELHNVQITTTPANNTVLAYETSSSLYKMKSIATLLGYTPADDAGVVHLAGTETITGTKTFTAATTTFAKVVANSPTGGATGEGLVVGSSFKLDASGVGQSAKIYVVTKDLSDTYGSGLQIQFANIDDNKGFGFNLNTAGGYELYTKDAGAAWVKAMTVSNAQIANFVNTPTVGAYTVYHSGNLTLSTLGGVPTSRQLTINGTSYDLSADRSWTISAGVSGSGTANQLAYWNGSSSVAGSTFLTLNLTADIGYLILTGGATYKNADIWLNRYSDAWENAIRFQTNGTTDWYLGSSATGSNSNLEFFSYGTSSAALTLLRSNANANFGASVGIGNTTLTGYSLRVSRTMVGDTASGITSFGIVSDGVVQSGVTSGAFGFNSSLSTASATFTLDALIHYRATQGSISGTSTVNNQYGFAALGTMTGATNNYGFFGSLDSATGRWNLYMSGTARNYLNGDTSIGTTTGGYKLNVNGTANISGALTGTVGTFSDTLTGTGLRSFAVNTAQTPSNNAGWYTLARFNTYAPFLNTNGNSGIITLSFYGGGLYTPSRYRIFYFKDDANVATLKLEKYGAVDYIQEVRIRYRTGDTRYYIEIYCDSHASGLTFDVHHDRLFGYGDQLEIFGGVLSAANAVGTILASLPFVDHGTTMSSLNVVTSASFSSALTANSFVKSGGIASQFLKADGTVDGSTYLTTSSASSTYVPYTGATGDVDLGFNNFDANQINGFKIAAKLDGTNSGSLILRTGTTGYSYGNDSISLISSPTSANTLTIISDINEVAKIAQIGLGSLTATRTYTLPDASGTIALTSNLSSYLPLTGGTLTNTGNDNAPILALVASSTDNFQYLFTGLNSSLAAGKNIGYWFGKSLSTKNSAEFVFQWNSNSGNDNFIGIGFYNANHLLKIYPTGAATLTGAFTASISALGSAATTFVVSDSGTLKSRTAAEVRSDIGAAASSDLSSYVTIGTDQTITGIKIFRNTGSDTLVIRGVDAAGTQGQGAVVYLGGNDGTIDRNYAAIYSRKENGTSGNPAAQFVVGVRHATLGMRDSLTIDSSRNVSIVGNVTAATIIKSGGLPSQFLKADGSVDSTTYLSSETDTLSSVTGRGASTSTNLTFNGTLTMGTSGTQYIRMGRFPASTSNTGEAWIGRASDRIAGVMTVQLGGSSNASFFEIVDHAWSVVTFKAGVNDFSYKGNTIYHSGNLTNLNQLTNGPGYITSYSETDTLSSVVSRGASTSTGITINPNGTSITMGGGASAEGIRMQATNSTTYPVFLRSVNPTGGNETSAWIFKEADAAWGLWHNNPINTLDITRASATGIENNVGGGTNTVMIRLSHADGSGQFTGNILNRTGTAILDQSGNTTGNAATATSATRVVTIQDAVPSGVNGQLWWESDTGRLKVYYGTASAWVDATAVPDMSLYFPKAGGTISGDVSIQQTLTVSGNTLVLGSINATGDVVAYSSSDIKLKDNISVIELPLEKIAKINGVSFNWNDKQSVYEVGKRDYGVIAQEVEKVLPELVTTRDNGYKAVRYEKIVALLIEAIKEQQIQIKELNKTVISLSQNFNSL